MADNDDFEIINESGVLDEQVFEFVDVDDTTEKNTNTNNPTTFDVILSALVPKPLVNEIPQVVEQQISTCIINLPKSEELSPPIKTTTVTAPVIQIKKTIAAPPSLPKTFAPVPSLPKPPPPQRYGNAALIPHNLNETLDIDAIINKSRKTQQITLNVSAQQQQQHHDIQTVLEQRRTILNKKN